MQAVANCSFFPLSMLCPALPLIVKIPTPMHAHVASRVTLDVAPLLAGNQGPIAEAGQTFTIEPILVEPGGSPRAQKWADGWTYASISGSLSAQCEVTVRVRSRAEGGGCEVLTPLLEPSSAEDKHGGDP